MIDLRKILIIFIIAVLFSVFVQALIIAVHPSPKYEEFCESEDRFAKPITIERANCTNIVSPTETEQENCKEIHGNIQYIYNEYGCPKKWKCETCQYEYDEARRYHNFIIFIISSIFGLIAIAIGLYLPITKNPVNHWISTGFMLGGLITLFIGTIVYYNDMGRYIRPVIMLVELVIVIYISYKKIKK